MRMSNEEYAAFVDSLSPRSPIWGDLLRAGLVGGAICVVGQALVNLYEHWGASAATAATWCSITLVFLGALLTGLGVYDDLARFAGAGSLVPITGFANSVVSPALEFKTEGFVTGTAVKIFTIAGCVTSARNWRSAMAIACASASPECTRPLSTTGRLLTLVSSAR